MSETHGTNGAAEPSLAERIYGPGGPIGGGPGDERTRAVIESGFAKPDPRFQDERTAPPDRSTRPAERPAPAGPVFDAASYKSPDGAELDPELLGEVGKLGIGKEKSEAAIALHLRAVAAENGRREAEWNKWKQATEREIGDRLPAMASDIDDAIGNDRDAARFVELLSWSGIKHDPAVVRVLHRLATGRGRY